MAGSTGSESSTLVKLLEEEPQRYSLYQSIRLLERLTGKKVGDSDGLFIHPELSLDYPAAEVAKIKINGQKSEIETSLLGLYGASSPLPTWYTEVLYEAEQEDKNSARILLDLFHQRLYRLFYEASNKYNLLYQVVEQETKGYTDCLFSLLGGKTSTGSVDQDELNISKVLLKYISLFRQRPRSVEGLRTILLDLLKDVDVEIIQCVEQITRIPNFQRMSLGKTGSSLGEDSILGEEIIDSNGKITIVLGPVSFERFDSLLNASSESKLLIYLIETYIDVPLECSLEIILDKNEARTMELGNPKNSCLGKNIWAFSGNDSGCLKAQMPLNFVKRFF